MAPGVSEDANGHTQPRPGPRRSRRGQDGVEGWEASPSHQASAGLPQAGSHAHTSATCVGRGPALLRRRGAARGEGRWAEG